MGGRGRLDSAIGRRAFLRMAGVGAGGLAFVRPGIAAVPRPRRKPTPRRRTVVLDAGHGGIDPGAISISGAYEKDIVFAIAAEAHRQLLATQRYRVVMTRTGDEFIPLHERVVRARAAHGDLFVSLHANALPDPSVRGASVFTLSEKASDREAEELAASENKVDVIAGIDLSEHPPDVSNILIDLARRETNNQSIGLARLLVTELGRELKLLNGGLHSAGFAVLKAPDVPSALVECGCLSNRVEDRLLRTASYRRKLAELLVRGINEYVDKFALA
jgi:N-acetylmuramoyl-L-alanine amidase